MQSLMVHANDLVIGCCTGDGMPNPDAVSARIAEHSPRREAFTITLSMPRPARRNLRSMTPPVPSPEPNCVTTAT
jgi:hypothetical protein